MKKYIWGTSKYILSIVAVSSLILGCGANGGTDCFRCSPLQRHEVASSHIAVLSVGDWDKYKKALKPTFKLTAEGALLETLPITTRTNLAKLRSLGLGIKAGVDLGSTLGDFKKTTTTDTSETTGSPALTTKKVHTEDFEQETYGPQDLSKVPGGESAPKLAEIARLLDKIGDSGLGSDPLLRYLTATALYQEVQMLESYLDDIPNIGQYKPYIVRLQLTLMPSTRTRPFDAYSDISFFLNPPGGVVSYSSPQKRQENQQSESQSGNSQNQNTGNNGSQPGTSNSIPGLKVLPLVITDNLEAAFGQQSDDRQRRLALGLLVSVSKVGAQVDGEAIDRVLREFAGKQYNSLFTMGRLSDNTLRVRLGAPRTGENSYAMMPRTHQITVLLLVPTGVFKDNRKSKPANITVTSKTFFVNALNGERPPVRSLETAITSARLILQEWTRTTGQPKGTIGLFLNDQFILNLLGYIDVNDFTGFKNALCKASKGDNENSVASGTFNLIRINTFITSTTTTTQPPPTTTTTQPRCEVEKWYPHSLWLDLLEIRANSLYASDSFTITQRTICPQIAGEQTALVYDYPSLDVAKVILYNARGIPKKLTAHMTVKQGARSLPWGAIGHEFSSKDGTLTLMFRSLDKWGIEIPPKQWLKIFWGKQKNCPLPTKPALSIKISSNVVKKPNPKVFTVTANYDKLVLDKASTAKLLLTVKIAGPWPTGTQYFLEVTNATIGKSSNAAVMGFKSGDARLAIKTSGTSVIQLENLGVGLPVTLRPLANGKPCGEPLVLTPLAPPAKETAAAKK